MVGSNKKSELRPKQNPVAKKNNKKRNKKPNPLVRPPKTQTKKYLSKKSNDQKKKSNDQKKKNIYFSSTAESLTLIKAYHTLNKRLEQNERDDTITDEERKSNADKIRQEQKDLGGIEKYQQASMYGAKSSKFVCAHWVEPLLREHIGSSKKQSSSNSKRPRILDVGAIDNQYLQYDWFDAVPIDLNAQHKTVVQADFFDYAISHIEKNDDPFDAIVLSLVLNFQGDPRKRGDMLALAADSRLLQAGGLVYVALPSASLDNSRYCDEEYLIKICESMNLKVVERKRSAKLALLAFQSIDKFQAYHVATKTFRYAKEISRAPAKSGGERNNFAIMLRNSVIKK